MPKVRRPSAAGYHSRLPSANWEISTLSPRVPTSSSVLRCWHEKRVDYNQRENARTWEPSDRYAPSRKPIDGTTPPLLPTLTTGSASADGLGMRMGQDRECVASRHQTRMTGVPCHESMNGIPDDVAGTMIPPKPASTGLGISKQAPHSGTPAYQTGEIHSLVTVVAWKPFGPCSTSYSTRSPSSSFLKPSCWITE